MKYLPTKDGKRKRFEKALTTSDAMYRAIVENAWEGIVISSTDGVTTFVNQRMADMLGYGVKEIIGRPSLDFSVSEWEHRVEKTYVKVCENDALEGDLELRRKDGSLLWTHYTAVRMFDERGIHVANMGLHTDINEHKLAEVALLEKTRQLDDEKRQKEDILESISDCFYALDKNLRFTYVNKAAEEIWSLSREELIGRKIEDVFYNLIDISLSKFRQVLKEQVPQHYEVYSLVAKKWGDMSVYPAPNGISVYFHDITERKRMESELAFQAHILSSMQDAICAVDKDFLITYWNGMAEKMFGWTESEAIGSPSKDIFRMVSPINREESIANLIKNNGYTGEAIYKKKDGEVIYTNVVCSVIRNPLGVYSGNVSTYTDITDRKRVEEALRESECRALDLIRVLEESDKSKNRFISILSHELRNPLAAITVGLSVLEVSDNMQQTESVKEIIKRQVSQLCKLVDDLLDLTRITQNKFILKKESIVFNEIVRDAVEDIKSEFVKKGVQIWEDIQNQPISFFADPTRITQCVGNLLHNAVKFTPANGNVWISLKQDNNEAVLRVRDDGIGISKTVLERLFHPFAQADESLDRSNNNGLGLGLSIIKGIVEIHDGKVSVTSDGLGKGALFTIRLPISSDHVHKQVNAAIGKPQLGFRILLIEDNKDLAELLHSMLCMWGHEVYSTYDGVEGIAKAQVIQPDIIICDIGLPGKNGFEVATIIKEDANLKNAFLIALSGYAGEHDIEQALKSGFDRHLAKPIDMEILRRMLSECLEM